MDGDIDNIVKLVLDAMSAHIYIDDAQVERIVVQKFEPGNIFNFSNPSPGMIGALAGPSRLSTFAFPMIPSRICDDSVGRKRNSGA